MKKLANKPDVTISRQLCSTVWHLGPTVSFQGGGEIKRRTFCQTTVEKIPNGWRATSLILKKKDPNLLVFYLLRMSRSWHTHQNLKCSGAHRGWYWFGSVFFHWKGCLLVKKTDILGVDYQWTLTFLSLINFRKWNGKRYDLDLISVTYWPKRIDSTA